MLGHSLIHLLALSSFMGVQHVVSASPVAEPNYPIQHPPRPTTSRQAYPTCPITKTQTKTKTETKIKTKTVIPKASTKTITAKASASTCSKPSAVSITVTAPAITVTIPATKTVTASSSSASSSPASSSSSTSSPASSSASSSTSSTLVSSSSTSAPPEPTFSCSPLGYLIQAASLYSVNLQTGETQVINSAIGDGNPVNALAFAPSTNVLYGFHGSDKTLQRIAGDGTSTTAFEFPQIGSLNVGDIDDLGNYWGSSGGSTFYQIDIRRGSPTEGQVLSSGSMTVPEGYSVADWVFIPSAGLFFSVATARTGGTGPSALLSWSRETQLWSIVETFPDVVKSVWGAQYGMDAGEGVVYASDNNSGEIWRFPVSGAEPSLVTNGPASGQNDGARCILNTEVGAGA